jgi:hypothetical protein
VSAMRRLEMIFGGPARPFPLTVSEADTLVCALYTYMESIRETYRERPASQDATPDWPVEAILESDAERLADLHDLRQRLRVHAGFDRRPR